MQQEDWQLVAKLVFLGSTIIVATVAVGVVVIASVRMWREAIRTEARRQKRRERDHSNGGR